MPPETSTEHAEPVPCLDKPRACNRPKHFLVESGDIDGGCLIGPISCALHLADTVAYAAACAQPVRVLDRRTVTVEQLRQFREARGGPWAETVQRERAEAGA